MSVTNARKSRCKNGHKFDQENTRIALVDGRYRRSCRACARERAAKARKLGLWSSSSGNSARKGNCSACSNAALARGLCSTHYKYWWIAAKPGRREQELERVRRRTETMPDYHVRHRFKLTKDVPTQVVSLCRALLQTRKEMRKYT